VIGVKTVNWHCGPSASAAPAGYPWGELDALDLDISASDRWAIGRAYQQLVLNAPPEDQASLDSRFASHVNGKLSKHNWALEFLLLFVPNVEELIVLNTNQWNIDIYWFTNIAANPERFQGLQSISINGPVRMENIIPLLTMPALKDLKLEQVFAMRLRADITYPWERPGHRILEDASCGLEKLAIVNSCVSTASVVTVLNACKGHKSFAYEHIEWARELVDSDDSAIDYHSLAPALLRHQATLEDFSFGISGSYEWEEQNVSLDLDDIFSKALL
jgi:hypothetical protein